MDYEAELTATTNHKIMSKRIDNENYFDELKEGLEKYADLKLKLLRIEAIEKVSKLGAFLVAYFIVALLLFMTLTFCSIAIGFILSSMYGSYVIGFGIVACIFGILLLISFTLRKSLIVKPILNRIIGILAYDNK
jgi:hypothetical protein